MAGAEMRKPERGRYTSAGYSQQNDGDLFIERVQAGSPQDLMRDNNRAGYAAPEIEGDGIAFSFFLEETQRDEARARETLRRDEEKRKKKEQTFGQRLHAACKRERRAAKACAVLLAANLVMVILAVNYCITSFGIQDVIDKYVEDTKIYEADVFAAQKDIEAAKNGERVRNIAQNELGMLRGERVDTQTIYIQTSSLVPAMAQIEVEAEESGLLDWLLSIADVFEGV